VIRAALAVLLVAVVAVSAVGYHNYRTGRQWRERAQLAERDVQRLSEQADERQRQLSDVRAALERSERDVARLERRLAGLADEKARAEDERESATAAAERIAEIAGAYDLVATQFQMCRLESGRFTDLLVDADYYWETGQWTVVTRQAATADAACAEAETRLEELRGYVDALA
jgi:chromosome segregation ATPase